MPHAVDQEDDDDDFLNTVLRGEGLGALQGLDDRELEYGEKAEDAQDFEDIGDDDLADEEELGGGGEAKSNSIEEITPNDVKPEPLDDDRGLFEDEAGEGDGLDDLFNSNDIPDSPVAPHKDPAQGTKREHDGEDDAGAPPGKRSRTQSFGSLDNGVEGLFEQDERMEEDDAELEEIELERLQYWRKLMEGNIPDVPDDDELFSIIYPRFEKDKLPFWTRLVRRKKASYPYKTPLKVPKPVHPTKVNLDLAPDQEKNFKLPAPPPLSFDARQADAESRGLVLVPEPELDHESEAEDTNFQDLEDSDGTVAGISWNDFVALCEDWQIGDDVESVFDEGMTNGVEDSRPVKARKIGLERSIPIQPFYSTKAMIDNPESALERLSKRVYLNMNDPELLFENQNSSAPTKRKRMTAGLHGRNVSGNMTKVLAQRYNISNDDAYDLLKQNHQHKVRSHLGGIAVEHALPAVKLQYPFYKVKLTAKEARAWHRPALAFQPGIVHFSQPKFVKRKHLRGKENENIFERAEDLSQGDNSNMLLLEYSEEYPPMMSSFGMNSKLINYYRRKDAEDKSRPRYELGETHPLLPQDKSPFSIFGNVENGQTIPTIHNNMYRAPIFKHDTKANDFLVARNSTSINGASWYLKNMENLHAVGQEFPLREVPGTHSRKVTDASKKRLRMLSYRMFRHNGRLRNEDILVHLPGSDIAQNRSKMREFMDYDKDHGWLPRKTDSVPEETTIRSWISPEDLCLLESMQVGDRHLRDSGYNKADEDMDEEDENDEEGQNIDKHLAPWQTTKNFLNACQGKAMLQLHGEGDPSGRGEAFNFIRTSMKGGFRELGESTETRLNRKETGGHSYNVARQQKAYNDTINRIWEAQAASLSSTVEHDDVAESSDDEAGQHGSNRGRSHTNAIGRSRRDDDSASVFSTGSGAEQGGRILRITREYRDKYGKLEHKVEIVKDPRVIREYVRRRELKRVNEISIDNIQWTGDEEKDAAAKKKIEAELARLQRNRERRYAREKAKGIDHAASPDAADSPNPDGEDGTEGTTGKRRNLTGTTQRKCANCGQVGHIKTNKKLCPLLNGTIKQDEGFGDSAFGSISGTPVGGAVGPASSPPAGFG